MCHTDGLYWFSVSGNEGFEEGQHRWTVQLVKRASWKKWNVGYEQVGVITDCQKTANPHLRLPELGNNLYYYAYHKTIYHDGNKVKKVNVQWNEGDIMHFRLDCDKWTLTFYLNDKSLGTFNLTPDKKYYPAVSMLVIRGNELRALR